MADDDRSKLLTSLLQQQSRGSCPECGAPVRCGVAEGKGHCWCFNEPPVLVARSGDQCLCRDCLRKAIAAANSSAPAEAEVGHWPGDDQ